MALPLVERACGNYVGVAGKAEERGCRSAARPEVAHATAVQVFAGEADAFQPFDDEFHAAAVVGGDRGEGDQLFSEVKRWVGGHLFFFRAVQAQTKLLERGAAVVGFGKIERGFDAQFVFLRGG